MNSNAKTYLVNRGSSAKRISLAEKIARRANREMEYDRPPFIKGDCTSEFDTHVFINSSTIKPYALLILERRTQIWQASWSALKSNIPPGKIDSAPMWSITFVWVKPELRKKGIASGLIIEAMKRMNVNELGWYPPISEPAAKLALSLYGDNFKVAK